LFSWGKGSQGQLGNGTLRDINSPLQIHLENTTNQRSSVISFELFQEADIPQVVVTAVSCGADFSLALDHSGCVWSWGGSGGSFLGHGSNVNLTRTINHYQSALCTPCESIPDLPKFDWLSPKRIRSLASNDILIQSIHAGDFHCVAISEHGNAYVWGQNECGELGLGEYYSNYCSVPTLVAPETHSNLGKQVVEAVACGGR